MGSCLAISSLAFFIGCGAAGEADGNAFGRAGDWLALTAGEGADRGGLRRGICPDASLQAITVRARTGMKRRKPEITLI
jgi:hypothetical protein